MPDSSPAQWTKLDRIRYLLDQWDAIHDPDAVDPLNRTASDGSGVPLLPLAARHPSVLELSRCLNLLLTANPGDYRHLKAFRCGSESRIIWVTPRIRGPHGKMIDGQPVGKRVPIIPGWIRKDRVLNGELFLERTFRGDDVYIPEPFWHAVNCEGCSECRPDLFSQPVAA